MDPTKRLVPAECEDKSLVIIGKDKEIPANNDIQSSSEPSKRYLETVYAGVLIYQMLT